MIFLVDENLPPALADWLIDRGHAAEHVHAIGLTATGDEKIVAHARTRGATIITKDADYARVAGVPVVWVRIGNTTNTVLLATFDETWIEIERALKSGELIVEVLA